MGQTIIFFYFMHIYELSAGLWTLKVCDAESALCDLSLQQEPILLLALHSMFLQSY